MQARLPYNVDPWATQVLEPIYHFTLPDIGRCLYRIEISVRPGGARPLLYTETYVVTRHTPQCFYVKAQSVWVSGKGIPKERLMKPNAAEAFAFYSPREALEAYTKSQSAHVATLTASTPNSASAARRRILAREQDLLRQAYAMASVASLTRGL